ncbi:MAG TPA: bifunctional aspartate kinase/homoserine dehydrogenase I [Myxococcota bacterium]|nr:bifunctional aspartate kinase/homoserine dehydrogenase I [Myxococcota bacterium]
MSDWKVLKFGGTSMGAPDRIAQVIEIITATSAGCPTAVVVSAMQHTTDRLIEASELAAGGDLEAAGRIVDTVMDLTTSNGLFVLQRLPGGKNGGSGIIPLIRAMTDELRQLLYAMSLLHEQTPQTLDLILSFGERLSASVLTELLKAAGLPAVFVDSRQWTVTDAGFGAAVVDQDATRASLRELAADWDGRVPVTTGFLGRTPDGRTTTLGRNGSDYTASLLARGLKASEVVVWTDVSGVMTADPGIVADAYPLARMSYMEALEMVDFGATLFHPRTMIPLIEDNIPMRIRNTMRPDYPGTLIDATGSQDESAATSVTSMENLALLSIQVRRIAMRAQVSVRVLGALEQAGVTVWMSTLSAHGHSAAAVVRRADAARASDAISREFILELQRGEIEPVSLREPVTLLTLVAEAMGRTTNVAGRFFNSLGMMGIPIRASAQGASERSISCVIDAADTQVAVRTVHSAFNFSHQDVSMFILGKGSVGGNLLTQIRDERDRLERECDVLLRVVGIRDSRALLFDDRGIDLDRWAELLAASGPGDVLDCLDDLRRLPVPILVDTTGLDGMEEIYRQALSRGIHVVAANKKPLTIPGAERAELFATARRNHRVYLYSTTVGASLPVIETLKNLVRTGDHVRRIEGSFSGTIGYITNELMAGVPLSQATRTARELGYTEPNPQDDLGGMDVARKALILTREMGLELEMSDLVVEPLLPPELMTPMSPDAFFESLKAYDRTMAERIAAIKESGKIMRYLAIVDTHATGTPQDPVVKVGPVLIERDHPAALLRGTEAFVAFTTDRFLDYPIIVQGSGAGGVVTAAGVLSDILKVSMTLRGR